MSDLLELPDLSALTPKKPDNTVLEFTVKRGYLNKALGRVSPVIPTQDLKPILKNFHFQISGSSLRISGSDSVLSVIVNIPVLTVDVSGTAVFPASRLQTIVREASGDEVYVLVRSKSGKLSAVVKSGKAKWEFPLMSPEGFPDFSDGQDVELQPVDRVDFHRALSQVYKAASQDVMRPYLMLVDATNGRLRASDSVRFQQVKFHYPFDCQIPVRAAYELVSRLKYSDDLEQIFVGQTQTTLIFQFGVVRFISQKSAAKFPDVDEVLLKPTLSNDQELVVDRKALLDAVRRVRVTADENTSAVVLSLNHGSVSVECKDRHGGFSVETVPADWTHAPRHVSFNHQHLTDLLSSTKSDKCLFFLGKDLKTKPTPLLMEDKEEGFTAVLSQIRLDWL